MHAPWPYGVFCDMLNDTDLVPILLQFAHLSEKRALRAASQALKVSSGPAFAAERTSWYSCGGCDHGGMLVSYVEFLDPRSGKWEPASSMAEARTWSTGAAFGGYIYICGGAIWKGREHTTLRSVERFDPKAQSWEAAPTMLEPREMATAAAFAGRLYVCGGMNPTRSSVESLGSSALTWEAGPAMLQSRAGAAASAFTDCLFVCGGCDDLHGSRMNLSTVERLQPSGITWQVAPSMATARFRPAAAVVGGLLYICGGESTFGYEQSVEVLGPAGNSWKAVHGMSNRRFGASAASMAGCLYVGGGYLSATGRQDLQFTRSIERLDPQGQDTHWQDVLPEELVLARQKRGDVWVAIRAS